MFYALKNYLVDVLHSKPKMYFVLVVFVIAILSVVFAAFGRWMYFGIGLIIFQIIFLLALVHTRSTLSKRLYSVGRKLERKIQRSGVVTPIAAVPVSVPQMHVEPATPAPKPDSSPSVNEESALVLESQISLIIRSEIFDQDWYEHQVKGKFATVRQACAHYLQRGRRVGFSPHPLFIPAWLQDDWSKSSIDPLIAYLNDPSRNRSVSTHPLFDPASLSPKLTKYLDRDWGALSTFLILSRKSDVLPYDASNSGFRSGITFGEVRDLMMSTSTLWRMREDSYSPLKGATVGPKLSPEISMFLATPDSDTELKSPLVSIVLPTWNRSGQLRAAIESVQRQSYRNWELLIADDGSIDDTALSVAAESERDGRVRLIRLEHHGVSYARNRAIERAEGKYIAFLDSDKVWDIDFLKIMILSMERSGWDAASAACEVSMGGRVFFRSVQATNESLAQGNSIDQTALVVAKSTLDKTTGFDETLRRAVDYDLILSIASLTKIVQVPFVGVRYSEDDSDPNRISEAESVAWNFHVRDRRNWAPTSDLDLANSSLVRLSIIIEGIDDIATAQRHIAELSSGFAVEDIEFLILLSNNSWWNHSIIGSLGLSKYKVVFVYSNPGGVRTLSMNEAIRKARGERLFLVDAGQYVYEGSLYELYNSASQWGESAIHPIVLGKTRLVDNAGVIYAGEVSDPILLAHGLGLDSLRLSDGDVVPGAPLPLLVSRTDALAVKGFDTRLRGLWADIDFSQRVSDLNKQGVRLSRSCTVQQHGPTSFGARPKLAADIRMFHDLWPQNPGDSQLAIESTGLKRGNVVGFSAASNPDKIHLWPRQLLLRPSVDIFDSAPQFRWSIRCAAPADDRSAVWGDFHFANSLAASLRKKGQVVGVDYQENAARVSSGSEDIVLNLRGLRDIPLPSDTLNLMWIISHPELVTSSEIRRYDAVYAASEKWAETQSNQWGVEIVSLLQCTDSDLFYPDYDSDIAASNEVLFVGNSRKVYRPAAWTAANGGFPIKIYGGGWKGLVPDEVLAGEFIPNDELRKYYSSAKITLNDHWADMRDQGFVSNRVFDVIAAGGRLITDDVPGMENMFPSSIRTFTSPLQLEQLLENRDSLFLGAEDDRTRDSAKVRSEHSFDARAETLLTDVISLLRKRTQG